jgi:hypothetical protein
LARGMRRVLEILVGRLQEAIVETIHCHIGHQVGSKQNSIRK